MDEKHDPPNPDDRSTASSVPWDADPDRWRDHRLPLGSRNGRLEWADPFHPVLVAQGAPRSGKTSGLAIPALAAWPGPAIVCSARFDVLEATSATRRTRGPVHVWDPSGLRGGVGVDRWDLLRAGASTWEQALRTARQLAAATPTSALNEASFWELKASQFLAPLLYAAAGNGYTVTDVVRWVKTGEEYEVRALLTALGNDEAIWNFDSIFGMDDRSRSGVTATGDAVISVLEHPSVRSSLGPGFLESSLFAPGAGAPTIYACAPASAQALLAPLFTLLLGRVVEAAVEHHLRSGEPARLLVVVDEAGNIGSVPGLAELTTTAAGLGVQLLTIFHDPHQIVSRYGETAAATILANSPETLFLPGRSPSAAHLLDDIVGDSPVEGLDRGTGVARLRGLSTGHVVRVPARQDARVLSLLAPWRDPVLHLSLEG